MSKPIRVIIIALASLLLATLLVIFTKPNPVSEVLLFGCLSFGVFLTCVWTIRDKKNGFSLAIFILVCLILQRLGLLNWLTFGLGLTILGLITLIN